MLDLNIYIFLKKFDQLRRMKLILVTLLLLACVCFYRTDAREYNTNIIYNIIIV